MRWEEGQEAAPGEEGVRLPDAGGEAGPLRPGAGCKELIRDLNTGPIKWIEEARTTQRMFKREQEKIGNKYGQVLREN